MNTITQQIHKHLDSLPYEMQEETLDFIRFLESKLSNKVKFKKDELNGAKLAPLMEEASKKNLFTHIKDPGIWQREIPKDRDLPLRED